MSEGICPWENVRIPNSSGIAASYSWTQGEVCHGWLLMLSCVRHEATEEAMRQRTDVLISFDSSYSAVANS